MASSQHFRIFGGQDRCDVATATTHTVICPIALRLCVVHHCAYESIMCEIGIAQRTSHTTQEEPNDARVSACNQDFVPSAHAKARGCQPDNQQVILHAEELISARLKANIGGLRPRIWLLEVRSGLPGLRGSVPCPLFVHVQQCRGAEAVARSLRPVRQSSKHERTFPVPERERLAELEIGASLANPHSPCKASVKPEIAPRVSSESKSARKEINNFIRRRTKTAQNVGSEH